MVVEDLPRAAALYEGLGFTKVPTDDDRCIGYVAGETGIILSDHEFATDCWGSGALAELAGRFVPYVFVERIDGETPGVVLADSRTWFGTHELLVRTDSGPLILAELA
jgi:hypothetical protein